MKTKQKGLLFVLAFSLFWAISIIINRFALLKGADPLVFAFQMVALSTILLITYSLLFRKKEIKKTTKKDILKATLAGVTAYALGLTLALFGLNLSTSVNYGFIIKTATVFTIILAYFFLKEKITSVKLSLMIILIFGAYLISTKGQSFIPHIGDLFILLAAFFYALTNVIVKPLSKRMHPELISTFKMLSGTIFLFIIILLLNKQFYVINNITILLFAAVFVALTQIFLNRSIKTTTISYVTMMSMLTPVIVVILAFILLKETLNLYSIIGGILIIVSGILINKTNISTV